MIALVVSLHVVPDHLDDFLAAIGEQAERSVTDEPGCLWFDVVQDTADPHHFHFYELYADEDALAAHRTTPHFPIWRAAADRYVVPGSQVNTIAERRFHHGGGDAA